MSTLITSLLGGNLSANRQASSTAKLLGSNAQNTLGQIVSDNNQLSQQQNQFAQLYSSALANATSILGNPVLNAGKLSKGLATNKTGPMGDQSTLNTATYKLLGG